MRPERFSGEENRAYRDHRSAWDRFETEPGDARPGREMEYGRPRRTDAPATLVRFRDYAAAPAENAFPASPDSGEGESPRRGTGRPRRLLLKTGVVTAVWLFGLVVGAAGVRFLPLDKGAETPVVLNDGEYVVEELAAEPALSPVREPVPASDVPQAVTVAAKPSRAPVSDSGEWSVEVLDTIASIPPWNPNGDLPDYVPAASAPRAADSFVDTDGFRAADSMPAPRIPAAEKSSAPFAPALPRPVASSEPSLPLSAEPEPSEPFTPSAERIAENESKPMKNEIEYFEPYETVSFSEETEPAVRVTASEGFYNDAYGVDNFSDYLPPRRDEENVPNAESAFGDR